MRLFIAINVPKELHRYCRQLQSQFPDLKKTKEFHLTVQFLGDSIGDAESIIEALKKVKFTPFEIEMGDITPFPDSVQPRGVWIECDPSAALLNLADEVRNTMTDLGYTAGKPFRAHVTLGRYKRPPDKKPETIKGEVQRFVMDRFYLMQSHLSSEGPHYKTLASFLK